MTARPDTYATPGTPKRLLAEFGPLPDDGPRMTTGAISTGSTARACFCVGPQNGDPVCPCMMRSHRERELGKKAMQILAQPAKPTWQTIDTAPKDGTRILVGRFVEKCAHDANGRIQVDRWHSRANGDGWDGFGKFNTQFWPATHWMPLPAPPEGR